MAVQYHRNRDAADAATPLPAPSHAHGSGAPARPPGLPSVDAHLHRAELAGLRPLLLQAPRPGA
eukprot:CAMPEP_0174697274 /NCGR_PEP_ID=MMETSP1094-20130205/3177_1 /TAXON_ID=156173 /ORGANISM="Chrysochromulina brevifilum, Strain UTEX LB 985" /LENGTH=63 /DNA_ID=CAMNT_0015894215 /DNA_START=264 /DNA_END=455 /DNA_ORIENTATION=+